MTVGPKKQAFCSRIKMLKENLSLVAKIEWKIHTVLFSVKENEVEQKKLGKNQKNPKKLQAISPTYTFNSHSISNISHGKSRYIINF